MSVTAKLEPEGLQKNTVNAIITYLDGVPDPQSETQNSFLSKIVDKLTPSGNQIAPTRRTLTHASFLVDAHHMSKHGEDLTNADYSIGPEGLYSRRIGDYLDALDNCTNIHFGSKLETRHGAPSSLSNPVREKFPYNPSIMPSENEEEVASALDQHEILSLSYPEVVNELSNYEDVMDYLPTISEAHKRGDTDIGLILEEVPEAICLRDRY